MIAGTLALLEEPAEETLSDYSSGGFDTLDVAETQTYLDDARVQHGRAAATVETEQEEIHVAGGDIDVERVPANERVWTEWVADVTDAGFVVAERTYPDTPPFPFGLLWARTGVPVEPAEIDTTAFIERFDDPDVWYTGTDAIAEVEMDYHNAATLDGGAPNIGVGFETPWRGTVVDGVIYASGYVAIYSPSSWGPMQFARFVREEIVPVADVPDEDDETEQETLGGEDDA